MRSRNRPHGSTARMPRVFRNQPEHGSLNKLKADMSGFRLTPLEKGPRPQKSLWEIYGALPELLADIRKRPEHYSEEQLQWVRALAGESVGPLPTEQEKTDLLLQFLRRTDVARTSRELLAHASKPTVREHTFEDQDFGAPLQAGDIVFA